MKNSVSKNETTVRVEKPWGHELIWAATPFYVGKILHVNKGHRLSLQYHNVKDETMFVYKGKVRMEVERDGIMVVQELVEGDSIRVLPKTKHRVYAIVDSDILEASTPHLDDVIRVQDDYQRA